MSHPTAIHAVGINRTGDFDAFENILLPFPEQKPGDILVKIEYSGFNFIDTYFRNGLYPVPALPFLLFTEVAGVIEELPTDETIVHDEEYKKLGLQKGGKIAIVRFPSETVRCVIDQAYPIRPNTLAEYISIPCDGEIYPIPKDVSTRTAAMALAHGLSALVLLTVSYNVKKNDTILVHTVAGGLGLLMCQLARSRGAIVIGTTSTAAKTELAKAHGADHVIVYIKEDTAQRVAELTNNLGPHAIFDGVGKDTFDMDMKMIRRQGTLVSLGNASGAVPPFALLRLSEKNVMLLRPTRYWGTQLWRAIVAEVLKINVFEEYPFTAEAVRRAHVDLTSGKTGGKLLIKVADLDGSCWDVR